MNFDSYRAIDAINFSALKSMRKSPLQFKYDLDHGRADSTGKALGRATHTAVLEPHKFGEEYAIYDGKIRKGKAWDLFEKENSHKQILKRDEAEAVLKTARTVRCNPVVAELLETGEAEKTIQWNDKATGLACKARLDFLTKVNGKLAIVDLKGCGDVRAEKFRVEAGKNFYHGQLAWYRDGLAAITGEVADCYIIAVEFKAPNDSAVYRLEEEALDAGWYDCAEMLGQVATCKQYDVWPGCYDSVQDLVLRKWETGISDEAEPEEMGLEFESDEESDG